MVSKRDIIRKFRIYLLHKLGYTKEEIMKLLSVSNRAVMNALSPQLIPKAYKDIKRYFENNPASTVYEASKSLNLSLGYISQVYSIMFPKHDVDALDIQGIEIAKEFMKIKEYRIASEILEIVNIPFDERYLLKRIPEDILPPSLKLLKFDYIFRTYGDVKGYIDKLEKFISDNDIPLYRYSALYMLLNAYMLIRDIRKSDEIINEMLKVYSRLPSEIMLNFSALAGKFAFLVGNRGLYMRILMRVRKGVNVYKSKKTLRKKVLMDLLISDGRFIEASDMISRYMYNKPEFRVLISYVLLNLGRFRELLKFSSDLENPIYRYYVEMNRNFARLFLGYRNIAVSSARRLHLEMGTIEHTAVVFYKFMALYHAMLKDRIRTLEYLGLMESDISFHGRISKALINYDASVLSDFRREKLLNLLMNRKFSKGKSLATRFGMHFDYIYFTTMLSLLYGVKNLPSLDLDRHLYS